MPPDDLITSPSADTPLVSTSQELSPDEFASGGVGSDTPPEAPTPAAAPDPSQGQPQQPLSVRDAIVSWGFQPKAADDYGALQELYRRAQQADALQARMQAQDHYARLGQQLGPHADKIQAYLQQQATQQAAPQRQPWEPPVFNREWLALVEMDQASGKYISRPNVDPGVAKAANEYNDYIQKFLQNPTEIINQAAKAQAQVVAREEFQTQFAQYQMQNEVSSILRDNASWMYAWNQDGTAVVDPGTGRQQFTRAGAHYTSALQTLSQAGVSSPAMKDRLAKQIAHGAILAEQAATGTQSASLAARQANAIAGGQPNRNPLQALSAAERLNTPGATEPDTSGLSFREIALRDMQAAGVSDADFSPEGFSPQSR